MHSCHSIGKALFICAAIAFVYVRCLFTDFLEFMLRKAFFLTHIALTLSHIKCNYFPQSILDLFIKGYVLLWDI